MFKIKLLKCKIIVFKNNLITIIKFSILAINYLIIKINLIFSIIIFNIMIVWSQY